MKKRALLIGLLGALLFSPAVGLSAVNKKEDVGDAMKSGSLAVASLTTSTQTPSARALWVTDEAKQIVLDTEAQNQFFAFIKSPFGNNNARANRIILNGELLDFSSKTQTKAMRAFLVRAHQEGMQVEFLTGKEYWVKDSSGMDSAMKRMDRVLAFNNGTNKGQEKFDGIHYDIRAYLNSGWNHNVSAGSDAFNDTYEKNYLAILTAARKKITQSGQNITLAVDVPTWYSYNAADIWKPLTAVNTPVNYIAIFNYFDSINTFLYGYGGANKTGGIGPNLAASNGVPIIFGASTKKEEENFLTFVDEDAAKMEQVFSQAVAVYGNSLQFKGLGVFNYGGYKAMKPGVQQPVAAPAPTTSSETTTSAPVQTQTQPTPAIAPAPASTPVSTPTSAPTPTPTTPVPAPVNTATIKNVRALWVWGEAYKIVTDAAAQDEFFAFLDAPRGDAGAKINRVYFFGDSIDINKQASLLRAFLKKAHEKGIAIEYLTGSSQWALTEEMQVAIGRCDRVDLFNAGTSNADERFDGIHLDIEPYLLNTWKDGSLGDGYNDTIEQNYLSILKTCRAKFDASGRGTTLSGDIPTWYSSKVSDIWNVISSAASPMHYLTVMNYFDTEATFLYGYDGANKSGGIGPNLAKDLGNIPMVFGAETINLEPVSITFAQEGFAALHTTLNKAFSVFGTNSKFGGVAVHHYKTYKLLQ